MGKHEIILRKKSNMLGKLLNDHLSIKMNILLEFISFKRLSKFLEQEGYNWVNLEKIEVLAWDPAGDGAVWFVGACGIGDRVSV